MNSMVRPTAVAIQCNANILTQLFLSKHIHNVSFHDDVMQTTTKLNKDTFKTVLSCLNFEEVQSAAVVKNIIACCLLHHMLLERIEDADAFESCLQHITERTYLPTQKERTYLRTNQQCTNVFKERARALPATKPIALDSDDWEFIFKRALMYPELYVCEKFNLAHGVTNSRAPLKYTLWNFLCDRNVHYATPLHTKSMIDALSSLSESDKPVLQQTMAKVVLQLLFHNN